MEKPHKHAELIRAWADGAEIEYYSTQSMDWHLTTEPVWWPSTQYRIKHTPVITKKYTFFDRIEQTVKNWEDLNHMTPQLWYDDQTPTMNMLEWTFTDNKLTSVEIKNATN